MVATFKPIKPPKLKNKEMYEELIKGLIATGTEIKKQYTSTTRTWETRPKFTQRTVRLAYNPYTQVTTESEIYKFVDQGTKPHKIFPKKARFLRFQSKYTAKTTPKVIGSKAGGSFGDWITSRGVNHPGTQAREFTIEIQKKIEPFFWSKVNIALQSAVKVSGHAI